MLPRLDYNFARRSLINLLTRQYLLSLSRVIKSAKTRRRASDLHIPLLQPKARVDTYLQKKALINIRNFNFN